MSNHHVAVKEFTPLTTVYEIPRQEKKFGLFGPPVTKQVSMPRTESLQQVMDRMNHFIDRKVDRVINVESLWSNTIWTGDVKAIKETIHNGSVGGFRLYYHPKPDRTVSDQ